MFEYNPEGILQEYIKQRRLCIWSTDISIDGDSLWTKTNQLMSKNVEHWTRQDFQPWLEGIKFMRFRPISNERQGSN